MKSVSFNTLKWLFFLSKYIFFCLQKEVLFKLIQYSWGNSCTDFKELNKKNTHKQEKSWVL